MVALYPRIIRGMLVKDVGEFQLIQTLARTIADENALLIKRLDARGFRLQLSIGDDAAAWYSPAGFRVLTTDTMVEGVHFNLEHIDWRDLGWRLMAANLSDLAAMGCDPLYSVVTLGLRGDLPVNGLAEMYRGMLDACDRPGGAIVGGDIVRSPVFFITVAIEGVGPDLDSGDSANAPLMTRSAACSGDKVAVTGNLGCSAGGLRMLTDHLTFEAETTAHLKNAHFRPVPRASEGITLARQGVAAALDVSDGLLADLGKLCDASGVGAVVYSALVPVDSYLKAAYPADCLTLALGGGEDYELLFAAPSATMDRAVSALDVPVTVIGEIVEGPPRVRVLAEDGQEMPMQRGGWDHFRHED